MTQQIIWRHINETPHSGWFMWDVYEVPATEVTEDFTEFAKKNYIPTLDGNYIYIGIYHSFNKETLQRASEGKDWDWDAKYFKVVVV
jgi:hypothetical protein